jgi:predicted dehydrogenase
MSENFRWGIIGTGGIARAFAKDLTFTSGHEVSAVGSRFLDKAVDFSKEHGGSAYGSYEELVASDVDAIYIATPHPMHEPNTLLALNAGKAVLCEKPFAVNAAQSARMIALAKQKELLLVEAMWSRFLPHYQLIRHLLADGELGEIISISADHGQFLPIDRHYKIHDPEFAGGSLLDLGVYPISLAHFILGKPTEIQVTAELTDTGVDSHCSIFFDYPSGAVANLSSTMLIKTPCVAEIIGSKARIEIDSTFYAPSSMRLVKNNREVIEFPSNYQGQGLREQAIEFAKLFRAGAKESDLITHQDSQEIMEIMDQIRSEIGVKYPFE